MLTRNCCKICVWSFVLAAIATKDSSQTEQKTSQPNSLSATEDQARSYFFYKQSEYPRDCAEVQRQCPSSNSSGVYAIKPDGYPGVFDAHCGSDGYTVIARRLDGLVSFNRSWEDYTSGFGFLSHEFWLGNQRLSHLTNQKRYQLLIDVELNDGSTLNAMYDEFRISDAHSNYALINTGMFSVDGGYCYWGPWTPCSVTCNEGVRSRHCRCTDGVACVGDRVEEAGCHEVGCPVDGVWSGWSDWTECPVTCGGDRQVRNRNCNNPAPLNGGRRCTGNPQHNRQCNTNPCPVDGGWSEWSDWAQCPVSCGGGDQVRQRECINPIPEHGGEDCMDDARQSQRCNTDPCQVSDCQDIYDSGQTSSGLYYINPTWSRARIQVYCNMADGGGWTVIQRQDGSGNFYRSWADYKNGFGSSALGMWLGNDKIHHLTNENRYELRIDLTDRNGRQFYATYDSFRINDESDKYRLSSVGSWGGNTGYNALNYHVGKQFSTRDQDNDGWSSYDCAEHHQGGWWFYNYYYYYYCYSGENYCDFFQAGSYCYKCAQTHLNANYNSATRGKNIFWNDLSGYDCGIQYTEMRIRPV